MSRASNAYVRDCYRDASRLNQLIAASGAALLLPVTAFVMANWLRTDTATTQMTAAMPIVIPITVNMLRILFLSSATKGTGFLYIRDEVSDRIWNTLAGKGWHDPELRAQRFQQFGTSSVACLWDFRPLARLLSAFLTFLALGILL